MAREIQWEAKVTLAGTKPCLMHKAGIIEAKGHSAGTDWSEEWKQTLNTDSDGKCVASSINVEAMLKNAARGEKLGKTPLRNVFAAGVEMAEFEVPFYALNGKSLVQPDVKWIEENGALFTCSAIVIRKRINRTRAMFGPGWQFTFTMQVLDHRLKPDFMKDFLNRAGVKEGWWDWRPGSPKPGKWGQFEVKEFTLLK